MERPSRAVMTSPLVIPALAAGLPPLTAVTWAPEVNCEPEPACASARPAPSWPWLAEPPAMISWATRLASLTGIENPTPMLPDWAPDVEAPAEAIATLIPRTSPELLNRGLPEFPGLMGASVCRTLILISEEGVPLL